MFIQCAKFLEEGVTIGDSGGRGRLDKRKCFNVAQMERFHSQNDFGEISALDFRLRERWPGVEILLRVKPNAKAVLDSPSASFALVGGALRDRLDRQTFDSCAWIVTAYAGETGINDETNARNSQGRFGDVGRDDELAARGWRKDTLLLPRTEPAEKGDYFRFAGKTPFKLIAGLANVAFARH